MQTPGLIVAPLTPFMSDLTLNEAALQRQIDYIVRDVARHSSVRRLGCNDAPAKVGNRSAYN